MKNFLQLGCILFLALTLNACRTIQGGGWIESESGKGKATFGVDLNCVDSVFYGEFTYHDHGFKMKMPDGKMHKLAIQAWVEPGEGVCVDFLPQAECTSWEFDYQVIPDKFGLEPGKGTIEFCDADITEDPNDKDYLAISLTDGFFIGYSNEGELGGGNLTIYDE